MENEVASVIVEPSAVPIPTSIAEPSSVDITIEVTDGDKMENDHTMQATSPKVEAKNLEPPVDYKPAQAQIGESERLLDDNKMDDSSFDEHKDSKTLTREMRSLKNSAKDSKIISEFMQIKTKMRKPRKELDTSTIASLNSSVDAERVQGSRRSSNNSLVSNSSDASDRTAQRRSMRSLNPEFVNKQKRFLNSLSGRTQREDVDALQGTSDTDSSDDELSVSAPTANTEKTKEVEANKLSPGKKLRSDKYCWRCHWVIETPPDAPSPPHCSVCPRSYHPKCVPASSKNSNFDSPSWVCPVCMTILHAEDSDSRSPAMQKTSLNTLCTLLNYALARMRLVNGSEEFLRPVDPALCPDYLEHVAHPMDLGRMQQNIADGVYGSTEAFFADTMWILHNCLVFNSPVRSRLTVAARGLVRECRKEMGDIEACPECYAGAHARRPTWFTDVCTTPHILLWAKLKGFPYWPAKGMSVNEVGNVDVRFFGDHDRAWVPAKYCFLYSQRDPNSARSQRNDIMQSVKEAEQHIKNITRKFGSFVHATPRTLLEPAHLPEQLKMMIPGYQGALPTPRFLKETASTSSSPATKVKRPRSNSKGSKDSILDGYGTDEEEPVSLRKMPDGVEIARDDDASTPATPATPAAPAAASTPVAADTSLREKVQNSDHADTAITPMRTRKRRKTVLEEVSVFSVLDTSKRRKRTLSHDATLSKPTDSHSPDVDTVIVDVEHVDAASPSKSLPVKGKDNDKSVNNGDNQNKPIESSKKINDLVVIRKVHKKTDETKISPNKNDLKTPSSDKNRESPKNKVNKEQPSIEVIDITMADSPPKSLKDRVVFIGDVETKSKQRAKKSVISDKTISGNTAPESQLPTITNVCSLTGEEAAVFAGDASASGTSPTSTITVMESNPLSSIFKASQRDGAGNLKEAVAKLQALRGAEPPPSSASASTSPTSTAAPPPRVLHVDIEIKAEPIDCEDVEKSAEKNDLLGSLNLRPTSSATAAAAPARRSSELRSVRRAAAARGSVAPRARKTFPQPRRASPLSDEARVDLNGKNSMVYIPIQPSTTQPPPRITAKTVRPAHPPPTSTSTLQRVTVTAASSAPSTVTSVVPSSGATTVVSSHQPPVPVVVSSASGTGGVSVVPMSVLSRSPVSAPAAPTFSTAPAVPPVSSQPLVLSSVNGQWTLCLPSMQTGAPTMVNGVSQNGVASDAASASNRPATLTPNTPVTVATTTMLPEETPQPPPLIRMRPGHPLDPATSIGPLPVPSAAGPASMQLNQSAVKLTDYFRYLLTESLELLEEPVATVAALRLQLEQAEWRHKQELAELKHNADMQLVEMRSTLERQRATAVAEARSSAEMELTAAVNHAKSKQWCANCRQEAQFYCCWNTSYCDYPCQQAHWTQHLAHCTQQQRGAAETPSATDSTTTKTVGGKVVPAVRTFGGSVLRSPAPSLAPNMLLNMQTGGGIASTGYKMRPQFNNQPAYLINKQLMTAEESTAKVTPGGYLIVGAGNTGRPAVVSHSQHSANL